MPAPPHKTTAKNQVRTTELGVDNSKLCSGMCVMRWPGGRKEEPLSEARPAANIHLRSSFSVFKQTIQTKPLSVTTKIRPRAFPYLAWTRTKAGEINTMLFTQSFLCTVELPGKELRRVIYRNSVRLRDIVLFERTA